jgi:SAM-dependent methyltransferase
MPTNDHIQIVCPKCKGELEELGESAGQCRVCGLRYRIFFDISDLRYPVSEIEHDAELKIAERLMASYSKSRFLDLVDIHYSSTGPLVSTFPDHLVSFYKGHHSRQLIRGSQFTHMLLARLREFFDLPDSDRALELGCGTGAGLVALSNSYTNVVGIDPSLSSLILAKKFCDENEVKNAQLVQAYGQRLPFLDNCFGYVTAQNVLEHVYDVDNVLAEVVRVLKQNGGFAADSRNRYDVLFPEPHVQLRGVGLLPRAWANSYVRWRIGMNYEAVHTRLLSYGDLRKALRKSFRDCYRIVFPKVSVYNMPKTWDTLLAAVERIEWLQRWLMVIFTSHVALAQKKVKSEQSAVAAQHV